MKEQKRNDSVSLKLTLEHSDARSLSSSLVTEADFVSKDKEISVSELRAVEISARSIAMLILPTVKVVNKLNPKIRTTSSEFDE